MEKEGKNGVRVTLERMFFLESLRMKIFGVMQGARKLRRKQNGI